MVIVGRTSNGWVDWKNEDGKSLHEMKRATMSAAQDDE